MCPPSEMFTSARFSFTIENNSSRRYNGQNTRGRASLPITPGW